MHVAVEFEAIVQAVYNVKSGLALGIFVCRFKSMVKQLSYSIFVANLDLANLILSGKLRQQGSKYAKPKEKIVVK